MRNALSLDLTGLKADWRTFEAVTGIGHPGQHHKSFLREVGPWVTLGPS